MKPGANVALTREVPDLTGVVLGLRFSSSAGEILTDNLVAATILCDASRKALSDEHFVFFNQLSSPDLSVRQLEEVLGQDNEQIEIDLNGVPPEVASIVVVIYLNEGIVQRRSLGQLRECTIRVLNLADNKEMVRSEDLAPALTNETAVVLGEMYRHDSGWKFKVTGQGYANGLRGIADDYGVTL